MGKEQPIAVALRDACATLAGGKADVTSANKCLLNQRNVMRSSDANKNLANENKNSHLITLTLNESHIMLPKEFRPLR